MIDIFSARGFELNHAGMSINIKFIFFFSEFKKMKSTLIHIPAWFSSPPPALACWLASVYILDFCFYSLFLFIFWVGAEDKFCFNKYGIFCVIFFLPFY